MGLPLSEQPHVLRASHCPLAWECQLPAGSHPSAGPGQAAQRLLPAAGLSSGHRLCSRRRWQAGEAGKVAAALTLFTEISISVTAVGT